MTSTIKAPLYIRLKVARNGLLAVFSRPRYLAIAALVALLVMGILLLLFNFGLLGYIFFQAALSPAEKASFVGGIYTSVFTNFNDFFAASIFVISVLSGINFALMIFVGIRSITRGGGKGAGALAAGLIGSGCAVCGTSIIGPILAAAGAGASVSLAETVGQLANLVAIALLVYSIYGLAQQTANRALAEK